MKISGWLAGALGLAMLGALRAPVEAAPIVIGTLAGDPGIRGHDWNGVCTGSSWGSLTTRLTTVYGEAFVVPTGATTLNCFEFVPHGPASGLATNFKPVVQVWHPSAGVLCGHGCGAPLFVGPIMSVPANGAFDPITVSTGCLPVVPGEDLVAYFETTDLGCQPGTFSMCWGDCQVTSACAACEAVYFNAAKVTCPSCLCFTLRNQFCANALTTGQLVNGHNWDGSNGFGVFAFQVTFSSPAAGGAPEVNTTTAPVAVALAAGALAVAESCRRRSGP